MNLITEIRDSWGWAGINPTEIVDENDFGNLIVRDENGCYWRICNEEVFCVGIAQDHDQLDTLFQKQEFLADWKMVALVDQARKTVGALTEERKYCLVIPSVLGGEYGGSNIKSAPLVEMIRFSGDLGKQIRDLPDGAKIQLNVID